MCRGVRAHISVYVQPFGAPLRVCLCDWTTVCDGDGDDEDDDEGGGVG